MIKSLNINEINFEPNKNFLFDPQFTIFVSQPSQVELDKSNIGQKHCQPRVRYIENSGKDRLLNTKFPNKKCSLVSFVASSKMLKHTAELRMAVLM